MQDAGLDLRALRNALGHYTTGVTIVTTRTPDGAHTGVTVNSFTSVSLDPPLVLFCLATRSSLLAAFEQAGHFAINVLAKSQQALSNRFARPSCNTWEGVKYQQRHARLCVADGRDRNLRMCQARHLSRRRSSDPGWRSAALRDRRGARAAGILRRQLRNVYARPVGRDRGARRIAVRVRQLLGIRPDERLAKNDRVRRRYDGGHSGGRSHDRAAARRCRRPGRHGRRLCQASAQPHIWDLIHAGDRSESSRPGITTGEKAQIGTRPLGQGHLSTDRCRRFRGRGNLENDRRAGRDPVAVARQHDRHARQRSQGRGQGSVYRRQRRREST